MRPDIKAMQRFRQCRDLAMVAPELTRDERRAHAKRVAEQAARDDAARAGSLMLSHAIYCDATIADKQRWFYKSQADWEKETGLTRLQQETARKSLVRAGILQEWRRGIPARLYFRISLRAMRVLLKAARAE